MSLCTGQFDPPAISLHGVSVSAVTVTYGDRRHLVRQVVLALLQESYIRKIVVVSNGAQWNVQALADELAPDRIEVVDLQTNRGSAAGFAAGIKQACEVGTDFVWLLDDDNKPQEGALSELLEAYARLNRDFPSDNLAVVGYRPYRPNGLAGGVPLARLKRRPSSFWGFHVLDIPYKFWCRTPWGRPQPRGALPPLVEVAFGPYGGLLLHRAVVERHGLPRADFVLYGDDMEFTYRITLSGGTVRLVTAARIADLEASWNFRRSFRTALQVPLESGSDLRVFYSFRNQTYLDSHCLPRNPLMYWANRRVYCFVLWLFALVSRANGRYGLLESAIRDGLEGRLGIRPEYPL